MASGRQYQIMVQATLNTSKIWSQLDAISKKAKINIGNTSSVDTATKKVKRLNTATQDFEKTTKRVSKTQKAGTYTGISKSADEAVKKTRTLGSTIVDTSKKVALFGGITTAFQYATIGVSDMVQNVFDLDSALTEYKKVSDLTGKGLEDFTDKAYKMGKTVARTGTEFIEGATQFKKMGYTDDESLVLAKTAAMFQNIADAEIDAATAASFINSQLKAFNMDASESYRVIDAVNEV